MDEIEITAAFISSMLLVLKHFSIHILLASVYYSNIILSSTCNNNVYLTHFFLLQVLQMMGEYPKL